MPKHIVRLVSLLVAFLLFAYGAIVYLTDPSFYRYGHFRADSVPELAAPEPRFRGPDYCNTCHVDRHAEWSMGSHAKVKCEICHGPAADHPANGKLPIPDDPAKLCSICHEDMPSRPNSHPQVIIEEHPYPHDAPLDCTSCHNPHSPAIGNPGNLVQSAESTSSTATGEAAPLSAKGCVGCHGANGQGNGPFPAIAGMEPGQFVSVMNSYKSGEKDNPMMNAAAGSLSDADLRELANYYAGLPRGAE